MYELRITAHDTQELDDMVRSYVGEGQPRQDLPPKREARPDPTSVQDAFCTLAAETTKELIGCLNVAGLGLLCDVTGLELPLTNGPISHKREALQRQVDHEVKGEPEQIQEPEQQDEEPEQQANEPEHCVACKGSGKNSKGGTCTPCGGTGVKGAKAKPDPELDLDTAEPITIEDLRAAAVEYIGTGDGSQERSVAVGDIFDEVAGTRKLSAIDEKHYSAIMAKLSEV
jgi:hypothetical protein